MTLGLAARCAQAVSTVLAALIMAAAGLARAPLVATAQDGGGAAMRYVDVSVATLWTSPAAPRAIDRPALGNPADPRAWNRVLTSSARRGLVGRIETQATFGEAVRVLATRGGWSRVVVVDQPTPRDRRGYPGWVPTRQLRASPAFGRALAARVAVVLAPTAWLRGARGSIEVSYGTRLPVRGVVGAAVVVATPDGSGARLASSAVGVYRSPAAIPAPSGAAIVRAARRFLGVRYLWGGTAAFGFDCSGLINLIYRAHGVVIPRDADAQARAGRPVAWGRLAPGDGLFYGRPQVSHAALYIGAGMMLEAPDSDHAVRVTAVRRSGFAGARRFVR